METTERAIELVYPLGGDGRPYFRYADDARPVDLDEQPPDVAERLQFVLTMQLLQRLALIQFTLWSAQLHACRLGAPAERAADHLAEANNAVRHVLNGAIARYAPSFGGARSGAMSDRAASVIEQLRGMEIVAQTIDPGDDLLIRERWNAMRTRVEDAIGLLGGLSRAAAA